MFGKEQLRSATDNVVGADVASESVYAQAMQTKQAAMARQPKIYALHTLADGGYVVMLGYSEVSFASNNLADALAYIEDQVKRAASAPRA